MLKVICNIAKVAAQQNIKEISVSRVFYNKYCVL